METKFTNTQIHRNPLSIWAITFLCFFFTNSLSIVAQNLSSSDKKAVKKYLEAQSYYQKHDLNQANTLLQEAVERDNSFIEAHTLIAYIHLDLGDIETAKTQFQKAIDIDPTAIPNNLFFLAEIELKSGEYKNAKHYFDQFLELNNSDPKLIDRSRRSLEVIDFAIRSKASPVEFKPVNLGPGINSELSEYFPSLTVDQKTILFTRRLESQSSPQGFNEDFYVSKNVNNEWQQAQNLQAPINTAMNEGAPSLSADGQLLIFTACELYGNYGQNRKGFGSCDLFYSMKDGRTWTMPINLDGTINSVHWETQPSFSSDGRTLYFVRGIRNKSGSKTGDIYVSRLDDKNYWSKPEKLSRAINTPGNEESVFIHPDGKTLYFSSDGHLGMGGLDIFMSKMDDEGNWGAPINLGYPINTHKNENSLLVGADGEIAYFASDREEGYGELDLYSFKLPEQFAPTRVTYFAGKIFNSETKEALNAKFELVDLATEKVVVESESNQASGEFLISLPSGRDYALNAYKEGFLFYSENFALKSQEGNKPFTQDVPLQPIKVGEKIVLKNIFFETAKFDLKSESMVELKKLLAFLKDNPKLKVEVSGHTDNRGDENLNKVLSENRAKSVFNYLVDGGIDENRLNWAGYGAELPIYSNDNEEGRAKNRRTEFKIIGL